MTAQAIETASEATPALDFLEIAVAWQSAAAATDPFRYGWRYVPRTGPDGREEFDQVPLTLEDVLHPQLGDHVVHSERHERRNVYLYDVFSAQVAHDLTAVVFHDVGIVWDIPGLRTHSPDIAVIFGVRERKHWSTFDVAEEGVRPDLIVEVTSPETAALDRSTKLDQYDRARVPLYVIVDTLIFEGTPRLRLLGYTRTETGYRVLAPNERGWLWLAPVRVWLGIADNEIVCYDEAGQPLGDYQALTATLNAEIAARLAAEQRATTAEQRASTAEQRATEAEQRASAEADARESAEAQLRALEAELRRLRGEQP